MRNPASELVVERRALTHGRRRRTYTVVRPRQPAPGAALVLVLHGTMQSADSMREFSEDAFDRLALGGNVVVYPDALHREWNGARRAKMLFRDVKQVDDVGFLRMLAQEVATTLGTGRVYTIGFSLGGQMVIRLVHEAPDLLAGAALLSANQPTPEALAVHRGTVVPVPLIAMHGTADPLSRFDGGSVSLRGWFPKGNHLGAARTAAYFARRNGIHTSPAFRWLGPEDGVTEGQVCRTEYRGPGCPPVTLYTLVGAGHQIPGASQGGRLMFGSPTRAIDAVTVIAEFFGLAAGR
ncbi:alpha/beta fold hydrolase [Nocardia sp. NEAU-G5]|uniref:Alpha/beta fold hydrolase n=1 Tax=Nocardia albiluteola TaxID=2842303 RepID=A0ABS6AQB2_9NOCA|nr:dienelactone hydrolase family protein [Nocardia albiluteola]MBU3060083.1 alpha/beta fold hydrolase [Nocardia albiluteola]